jgi:hypothetical protein
MIYPSAHLSVAGDIWNTGVYDQRENTPKSGSVSFPDTPAKTGKPRKSSLFRSCGEYA